MPDHSNANRTMIEAVGLSKFYGEFAATREVTFSVPLGQVCAFLGPNGAGKSTTMKMLTGYLAPSDGEARIGVDRETARPSDQPGKFQCRPCPAIGKGGRVDARHPLRCHGRITGGGSLAGAASAPRM